MRASIVKRLVLLLALVVLVPVIVAAPPAAPPGAPPMPPPRQIPAINAPDQFPHGCVDCHVDYGDLNLDARLSTLMKQWQSGVEPNLLAAAKAAAPAGLTITGRHPDVTSALEDIPNNCLACHSRGSLDAPPFARLLHRIHFADREDNHFLTMFQGECTHCHKLDASTGAWSLRSGPER